MGAGGAGDAIDEIYAQLPPAQLKESTPIHSSLNLTKSSLRLKRNADSETLSYNLSFRFDTLVETRIKIYWGGKELPIKDYNLGTQYKIIDKHGQEAEPWVFGPFPPSIHQSFQLPSNAEFTIDNDLLKQVNIGWVSELDLLPSPIIVNSPTDASPQDIISVTVTIDTPTTKTFHRNPEDTHHLVIVIESTAEGSTGTSHYIYYQMHNLPSQTSQLQMIRD